MIKDNDKTRPARPLCPNHQNFPSHSNATPQMLPQKIVFFSWAVFSPQPMCSERLNWCHKNSFLAPQVFPTLPRLEARIYFKTVYCIGRPSSILISKRLRIYRYIGVGFEENTRPTSTIKEWKKHERNKHNKEDREVCPHSCTKYETAEPVMRSRQKIKIRGYNATNMQPNKKWWPQKCI